MDRITLRLSADLIRRFDAAARSRGGRSRWLRSLMESAARAPFPEDDTPPSTAPTGKLSLRLGQDDLAVLEGLAADAGLSRTQWTCGLIRCRLHARPQLTRPEATALIEVRRELRRIGVNVNQIARALNTAVLEGRVLDVELRQLEAFRTEIAVWVTALGEAFQGNLDYWRVDP